MIATILVLAIFAWLALYLILRRERKKVLAADFPLFALCGLLLGSDINMYTSFGDNRHIGLSISWLPILYWFYIRKSDVAFLFNYKPVNLLTGCLMGIVFGISVAVFFKDTTTVTSGWIPGLVFYTIQKSLAEEMVFRCLLINYLKIYISNDIHVTLVQGLIFGVFHLGGYFHTPILLFLPLSFAFLAGFILLKQKSLYGSFLAHTLNNLILIAAKTI